MLHIHINDKRKRTLQEQWYDKQLEILREKIKQLEEKTMEWREEQQLIEKVDAINLRLTELEDLVKSVITPVEKITPEQEDEWRKSAVVVDGEIQEIKVQVNDGMEMKGGMK